MCSVRKAVGGKQRNPFMFERLNPAVLTNSCTKRKFNELCFSRGLTSGNIFGSTRKYGLFTNQKGGSSSKQQQSPSQQQQYYIAPQQRRYRQILMKPPEHTSAACQNNQRYLTQQNSQIMYKPFQQQQQLTAQPRMQQFRQQVHPAQLLDKQQQEFLLNCLLDPQMRRQFEQTAYEQGKSQQQPKQQALLNSQQNQSRSSSMRNYRSSSGGRVNWTPACSCSLEDNFQQQRHEMYEYHPEEQFQHDAPPFNYPQQAQQQPYRKINMHTCCYNDDEPVWRQSRSKKSKKTFSSLFNRKSRNSKSESNIVISPQHYYPNTCFLQNPIVFRNECGKNQKSTSYNKQATATPAPIPIPAHNPSQTKSEQSYQSTTEMEDCHSRCYGYDNHHNKSSEPPSHVTVEPYPVQPLQDSETPYSDFNTNMLPKNCQCNNCPTKMAIAAGEDYRSSAGKFTPTHPPSHRIQRIPSIPDQIKQRYCEEISKPLPSYAARQKALLTQIAMLYRQPHIARNVITINHQKKPTTMRMKTTSSTNDSNELVSPHTQRRAKPKSPLPSTARNKKQKTVIRVLTPLKAVKRPLTVAAPPTPKPDAANKNSVTPPVLGVSMLPKTVQPSQCDNKCSCSYQKHPRLNSLDAQQLQELQRQRKNHQQQQPQQQKESCFHCQREQTDKKQRECSFCQQQQKHKNYKRHQPLQEQSTTSDSSHSICQACANQLRQHEKEKQRKIQQQQLQKQQQQVKDCVKCKRCSGRKTQSVEETPKSSCNSSSCHCTSLSDISQPVVQPFSVKTQTSEHFTSNITKACQTSLNHTPPLSSAYSCTCPVEHTSFDSNDVCTCESLLHTSSSCCLIETQIDSISFDKFRVDNSCDSVCKREPHFKSNIVGLTCRKDSHPCCRPNFTDETCPCFYKDSSKRTGSNDDGRCSGGKNQLQQCCTINDPFATLINSLRRCRKDCVSVTFDLTPSTHTYTYDSSDENERKLSLTTIGTSTLSLELNKCSHPYGVEFWQPYTSNFQSSTSCGRLKPSDATDEIYYLRKILEEPVHKLRNCFSETMLTLSEQKIRDTRYIPFGHGSSISMPVTTVTSESHRTDTNELFMPEDDNAGTLADKSYGHPGDLNYAGYSHNEGNQVKDNGNNFNNTLQTEFNAMKNKNSAESIRRVNQAMGCQSTENYNEVSQLYQDSNKFRESYDFNSYSTTDNSTCIAKSDTTTSLDVKMIKNMTKSVSARSNDMETNLRKHISPLLYDKKTGLKENCSPIKLDDPSFKSHVTKTDLKTNTVLDNCYINPRNDIFTGSTLNGKATDAGANNALSIATTSSSSSFSIPAIATKHHTSVHAMVRNTDEQCYAPSNLNATHSNTIAAKDCRPRTVVSANESSQCSIDSYNSFSEPSIHSYRRFGRGTYYKRPFERTQAPLYHILDEETC